jgi:serine/threonine protein kinase
MYYINKNIFNLMWATFYQAMLKAEATKEESILIKDQQYKIGNIIAEGSHAKVRELIPNNSMPDQSQMVIKIFFKKIPPYILKKEQESISLACNAWIIDNKKTQAIVMDRIPGMELYNILSNSEQWKNITSFVSHVDNLFLSIHQKDKANDLFSNEPALKAIWNKCQSGIKLNDSEAVGALNNLLEFIRQKSGRLKYITITEEATPKEKNEVLDCVTEEFWNNHIYPLTFRKSHNITFLQTVLISNQAARLIAHYHKSGVIHRDIKPENIMVDLINPDSTIKDFPVCSIIDFGFAAQIKKLDELYQLPIAGTHGYIPPEARADNKKHIKAGSATDVFALGTMICALFFNSQCLITDTKSFGFTADQLLENQQLLGEHHHEKKQMSDFNDVLCNFLAHMLNAEVAQRANIIVVENFLHSLQQLCFLCRSQDSQLEERLNLHIIRLRLLTIYPQLEEQKIPDCITDVTEKHRELLKAPIPPFEKSELQKSHLSNYATSIGLVDISELPKKEMRSIKSFQSGSSMESPSPAMEPRDHNAAQLLPKTSINQSF